MNDNNNKRSGDGRFAPEFDPEVSSRYGQRRAHWILLLLPLMLAPGLSAAVPWLVPEQPANSDSNSDSSRDANRDANQAVADELRAHGERLDRMTGQLEATSDRLGRIESEQAGIVERLQTLEQAVTEAIEQGDERAAETRQSTDSLSTAVAELQVQMQEVWQREGEQREIDREIQRRLLLMEAASLLAFGQARAALGSDVEAALEAYRQADALVRRADDPSLGQIRRLLAEELDALADMSVPDWVQLQGMIQRQAARVAEWPVVQPGPTDRTPDSAAEPDGWIEATRDALGGLVRVSPRAESVLTDRQVESLQEMARLRWLAAELAIARRNVAELDHHLRSLDRLITEWFDPESDAVRAARRLISELQAIEVSPAPDVLGQALAAVQQQLDSA